MYRKEAADQITRMVKKAVLQYPGGTDNLQLVSQWASQHPDEFAQKLFGLFDAWAAEQKDAAILENNPIRAAMDGLDQRLKVIEWGLAKPDISEEEKQSLESEKMQVKGQKRAIQCQCGHQVTDPSHGGGIFCSICDAMVDMT